MERRKKRGEGLVASVWGVAVPLSRRPSCEACCESASDSSFFFCARASFLRSFASSSARPMILLSS